MMEVVFSRSACGSLKMAQHYGQGEYTGAVSVIVAAREGEERTAPAPEVQQAARQAAEQRARREWEEARPLRVCLNGGLQSMPENFYDSFILRELERLPEEFLEASLVGNVLGKYQLGLGDGWLALRIEAFCRQGLLEVVQDGPGIRRRLRQHSDWASL